MHVSLDGYRRNLTSQAEPAAKCLPRGRSHAIAGQIRHWTGQGVGGEFLRIALVFLWPRARSPLAGPACRRGERSVRGVRPLPRAASSSAGPEQDAVGRERYALAAAPSSAPPSISTRPTRGAGKSSSGWTTRWRARTRSCPAAPSTRPSPPSTPTRHAPSTAGALPRLDAGAHRPRRRRDGRRALRHPRADPQDRVPIAPTKEGGIYYTGPARTSPGPAHVVVGARGHRHASPPGAS